VVKARAGNGHDTQTGRLILLLQLFLLVRQREYKHLLRERPFFLLLACLLVEKAQNLSSRLFATSFFVGHDAICRR
jgi:hypothetical protein